MSKNRYEKIRKVIRDGQDEALSLSVEERTESFIRQADICLKQLITHFSTDAVGCFRVIVMFIAAGIGLDRKYSSEEKKLITEWANTFDYISEELSEELKEVINAYVVGKKFDDFKKLVGDADRLLSILGKLDSDLMPEFATLFLIIASIDGEITPEEEDFLIKMFDK